MKIWFSQSLLKVFPTHISFSSIIIVIDGGKDCLLTVLLEF